MANAGFIELGIIGTPMAGQLIKGGHQVFLYSISRIPPFSSKGVEGPAQAARKSRRRPKS